MHEVYMYLIIKIAAKYNLLVEPLFFNDLPRVTFLIQNEKNKIKDIHIQTSRCNKAIVCCRNSSYFSYHFWA